MSRTHDNGKEDGNGHFIHEGEEVQRPLGAATGDDDGDAFLDLDDPGNEVLDETAMPAVDPSDMDLDNDENENEEEPIAAVDLNTIPDREPERDDALCHYVSRDAKPLHSVCAHPQDLRLFAAGGEGDEVYVLRLRESAVAQEEIPTAAAAVTPSSVEEVAVLRGHDDTIGVLSFSPDGAWLASGGMDAAVSIWWTATWERVHCLRDLGGEILSLLWHPTSRVLVATADDAQAAMWNVVRGTLAMLFAGHGGPVACAAWTADLRRLVTGGSDGAVMIFSPKSGEREGTIARGLSEEAAPVTALCVAQDERCAVGCADGSIHIISLRAGRAVATLEDVHEQAIESLRLMDSAAAALMLSASCDCRVAVWNTTDFSPRAILQVGESVIPAVWHSHWVVAGCGDGDVRIWDGRAVHQQPLATLSGHRRMILDLVVHNGIVATASDDGTVRFFRLPNPAAQP